MIPKEVIDYVRDCNDDLKKFFNETFSLTMSNFTKTILSDNQEIKDKIKDVKEKVETQNGSIHELKEWKAGIEGGKKTINNIKNWLPIIIAALALGVSIVVSSRSRERSDLIEQKLWWKQDRQIDSATRGGYVHYEIIKDTIR